MSISAQRLVGFGLNSEVELSGKTHTTKHSQRVVGESDVRIERSCYDAVFHIVDAIKGVYQFAKSISIQAYGKSVDGEVATILVVFQSSVFDDRLARVVSVAFLSCTHKLHLCVFVFNLCCTEILKYRNMSLLAKNTF